VYCERAQFLGKIPDLKDHKGPVEANVRRSSEQASRQRALDIAVETCAEAVGHLTWHFRQRGRKITKQRCRPVVCRRICGDSCASVGPIQSSIEHGSLVGVQRAGLRARPTGGAEHDFEQTEKGGHPLSQWLFFVDHR
jgi:hypothetical protein